MLSCGRETTHWPQQTQCPHVQENEAGTITNLQLRSLKTSWPNIYCRDARFCRLQEQTCGQRQSSYTPNSTAVRRNWKRWPPSSCKQDSQCSGDREEKKDKIKNKNKIKIKTTTTTTTKQQQQQQTSELAVILVSNFIL